MADPAEDRLLRRLGGDGQGDTPRWRARFAAARQAAIRATGHTAARVVAAGLDGTLIVAVGADPDGGPGGPGAPLPQRYAVGYAEIDAPTAQQEHATALARHRYVVAWTTGAASREESHHDAR
ncbi:hypothetical protein [Frankia sp. QA3]|uniref:hypothetical protein n=1 Tax=Frankia sp. QA3 TaxID=710111 RepID=UPI00055E05FE|nr:hypothetical protein [Frankia sp. QA3]